MLARSVIGGDGSLPCGWKTVYYPSRPDANPFLMSDADITHNNREKADPRRVKRVDDQVTCGFMRVCNNDISKIKVTWVPNIDTEFMRAAADCINRDRTVLMHAFGAWSCGSKVADLHGMSLMSVPLGAMLRYRGSNVLSMKLVLA